ncbi:hypothetical protein RND71_013074 [Anisodus tanguticus]|uniref:Uncharacterized protein n=1 Tax=Anisodus tanguticus TaxID=243964 RepID=A0AAE1SGL5_9SOLA|nr:hypothetical protein RND71_013074 [Anisodus tanguticus]
MVSQPDTGIDAYTFLEFNTQDEFNYSEFQELSQSIRSSSSSATWPTPSEAPHLNHRPMLRLRQNHATEETTAPSGIVSWRQKKSTRWLEKENKSGSQFSWIFISWFD